jgi:hypothetical protein
MNVGGGLIISTRKWILDAMPDYSAAYPKSGALFDLIARHFTP